MAEGKTTTRRKKSSLPHDQQLHRCVRRDDAHEGGVGAELHGGPSSGSCCCWGGAGTEDIAVNEAHLQQKKLAVVDARTTHIQRHLAAPLEALEVVTAVTQYQHQRHYACSWGRGGSGGCGCVRCRRVE